MNTIWPAAFKAGHVVIDFRDWTHAELRRLRALCKLIQPDRDTPAFSFGDSYFCEFGRWYRGAAHNLVTHKLVCRVGDIYIPELDDSTPKPPGQSEEAV